MRKTLHSHHAGFSLIDIIMGMLAAAVLVLTMGTMLFYGYKSYVHNSQMLELHRDGTAAVQMLTPKIRGASPSRVTVAGGQITILPRNIFVDPTVSFFTNDHHLVFDPDTGIDDNEVIIIHDSVLSFAPSGLSFGVAIQLVLSNNYDYTEINSTIAYRN